MPRRNIEFKARDPDPERTLRTALGAGAQDAGWLAQTDTYFNVPHGRLKLREESDGAHLIAYQRPDDPTARESCWQNVRIHLDTVDSLGQFIEIEAVADPTSDLTSEHQLAADLQARLGITPEQIIAFSYSDEMLRTHSR